jgi:hypothetical protein
MLVSTFIFIFLKAISHPPIGVTEDAGGEREIELGGQTTTTTVGMKLG